MGVITKTEERNRLFISLWEDKNWEGLFFWIQNPETKKKEKWKINGEIVKGLNNIKLVSLAYQHIDKQDTNNPKYGDINNFTFKFIDLDEDKDIYITMRPNAHCNTMLLYLLSDDLDVEQLFNIIINPDKKRIYINQKWKDKISWKYNVDYISNLRNEKWNVEATLTLMKELANELWKEIFYLSNK